MRETRFGRAARLLNAKAGDRGFRIGLEAIESATGRLAPDPAIDYAGDGVAFEPGDLLFGKLRPYLAKAWLADRSGAAVGDFHVYRPLAGTHPRYLLWVVLGRSFLDPVVSSVFGAKMPRANWEFVRNVEIYLPPVAEQQAIAGYLDRETARIDTLIEEQQRLVEMLRERRAACVDITLADRGFRSEGLGWAGEPYQVPAGWQVVLLGRALDQLTNGFVGPTRDILTEDGIRYVQGTHIKNGQIEFSRRPFYVSPTWHHDRPRIHLREGDVLIVQTGDIGRVAVVPPHFGDASCHALLIARVKRDLLSGPYLGAFLESRLGYNSLLVRATGALHPHLESGIRQVPIVIPPREIQDEIVHEVGVQTSKIDALIAESERFIELSRERRSALITAAVTGQIDVRDEVA